MEKLVPRLRFPGFEGEWKVDSLKNIGIQIIDGDRGVNYPNGSDFTSDGFCLFMNAKNVTKVGFSFDETSFISEAKDIKLNKGKLILYDIILTTRGSVGHIAYFDEAVPFEHLRINSGMVIIRTTELNKEYLYRYLNTNQIQNEIDKVAFGSAQPQLTVGEIYKFKIAFPTANEQTKIAFFLKQIYLKVDHLKKKKALLEKYKKGMLQKIFNQEVRFKDEDGKDFGEWKEMRFGEVFTFRTTNSLSRENLNYDEGNVKNIHYGDIHTKFDSRFDITKKKVPFINSDVLISRIDSDNYCKNGDLVVADASEDYEDIAKSIEIINSNNEKILAGLHTFLARPDLQSIAIGYSGYMMQGEKIRNQIKKLAQGTKVLSISTGRLSSILIPLPKLEEQTKIANLLSAIDDKINLVAREMEEMEFWKKGLLGEMFV